MRYSSYSCLLIIFGVMALLASPVYCSADDDIAFESKKDTTARALRSGGSGGDATDGEASGGDASDDNDDDTCEAKLQDAMAPHLLYVQMANKCILMRTESGEYTLMTTNVDDDTYAFTGKCLVRDRYCSHL